MSAPAIRAGTHQWPEMAAHQGKIAQEFGESWSQILFCESITLNSRAGGGCADLP